MCAISTCSCVCEVLTIQTPKIIELLNLHPVYTTVYGYCSARFSMTTKPVSSFWFEERDSDCCGWGSLYLPANDSFPSTLLLLRFALELPAWYEVWIQGLLPVVSGKMGLWWPPTLCMGFHFCTSVWVCNMASTSRHVGFRVNLSTIYLIQVKWQGFITIG